MSETTTIQEVTTATTVEVDTVTASSDTAPQAWKVDALTPLVETNADRLVSIGGMVMTLSEATRTQLPSVTKEDDQWAAIDLVQNWLANPVEEEPPKDDEEEPVEEKQPAREDEDEKRQSSPDQQEEIENPEEPDRTEQPGEKTDKADDQPAAIAANTLQAEQPPVQPTGSKSPAPAATTNNVGPRPATSVSAKAESPAGEVIQPVQEESFRPPKSPTAETGAPASPRQAPEDKQPEITEKVEPMLRESVGEVELPVAELVSVEAVVELASVPEVQTVTDSAMEIVLEAAEAPLLEIPEIDEMITVDHETDSLEIAAGDEDLELPIEEIADDENLLPADYLTPDRQDYGLMVEGEAVVIDHFSEAEFHPDGPDQLPYMSLLETLTTDEAGLEPQFYGSLLLEIESADMPGPAEEITAIFAEAEDSLTILTEQLETAEPEMLEAFDGIIAQIMEASAALEVEAGTTTHQAEVQEELEELFTELLDTAGIEYTPELVETLAKLTISWRLAEKSARPKTTEEPDELPNDGTHEIIKQLLIGSSNMKRAMEQASTIGKSALRLYRFKLTIPQNLALSLG